MIKHELFPTLIAEFHYDCHEEFKRTFYDRYSFHSNPDGNSSERTGHVDIHRDDSMSGFWSWVGDSLKKYIAELCVEDVHDLYIVKSWLMPTKTWHVPRHKHADAHLSFVYYVNLPPNSDAIYFESSSPNELYHDMFGQNAVEWNRYNSRSWFFNPVEGGLFVFPSKTYHYTANPNSDTPPIPDTHSMIDLKNKRMAIAGDAVLTYKKNLPKAYGLMPIDNWKKV